MGQEAPQWKYVRKLGFLYEWLTGQEVPLGETSIRVPMNPFWMRRSTYRPSAKHHALARARQSSRYASVVPDYSSHDATRCAHRNFDIAAAFSDARARVPPEIFERAVSYAYLAETQASYAIERDAPTPTQRRAFLRALESAGDMPVSERLVEERLVELQELVFKGIPRLCSMVTVPTTRSLGARPEPVCVAWSFRSSCQRGERSDGRAATGGTRQTCLTGSSAGGFRWRRFVCVRLHSPAQ